MQYALVNGVKQEASPGGKGICDLCEREVFAKCGGDRVDHWAHMPRQKCEDWWERETDWHRDWKKLFPPDMCEVVMEKDGVKHRADVRTGKGTVVEFQHSNLGLQEICEREAFYGPDMYWVLDADFFKPDLIIQKNPIYFSANLFRMGLSVKDLKTNQYPYRWIPPKARWNTDDQKVFFDFGEGFLYTIISFIDKADGGICQEVAVESFVEMVMGKNT